MVFGWFHLHGGMVMLLLMFFVIGVVCVITDPKKMKYKRRSTGEEKVQKIAAGEEVNYRMERVPPKAD